VNPDYLSRLIQNRVPLNGILPISTWKIMCEQRDVSVRPSPECWLGAPGEFGLPMVCYSEAMAQKKMLGRAGHACQASSRNLISVVPFRRSEKSARLCQEPTTCSPRFTARSWPARQNHESTPRATADKALTTRIAEQGRRMPFGDSKGH
jgi:hypothetical protein